MQGYVCFDVFRGDTFWLLQCLDTRERYQFVTDGLQRKNRIVTIVVVPKLDDEHVRLWLMDYYQASQDQIKMYRSF